MREKCECGKKLPTHLLELGVDNVCLCGRKWVFKNGEIVQDGTEHNPVAEFDGAGKYPYEVGLKVRALRQITEDGTVPGDPTAEFPRGRYIHAEEGDVGTVEGVDDNTPTVRFERTGTATIVGEDEVTLC
jgi:hypothetical protein